MSIQGSNSSSKNGMESIFNSSAALRSTEFVTIVLHFGMLDDKKEDIWHFNWRHYQLHT